MAIHAQPQNRLGTLRRPDPPDDFIAPPFSVTTSARYFGGSGDDSSTAVAVDVYRNTYIAGQTSSPELLAAVPLPPGTTSSRYLAKYDAARRLAYVRGLPASGLGGRSDTIRLAVDVFGNVYVAGEYTLQVSYVAKYDSGGNSVYFVTTPDIGVAPTALTVDAKGNAILVGGSGRVVKLNGQGQVVFLRDIGVAGTSATAVAVDIAGAVYVAGSTNAANFPATPGSFQPRLTPGSCVSAFRAGVSLSRPCSDAFVTKLDPSGAVVYASFFGGSSDDDAVDIAVDATGSVSLVGSTSSRDLPLMNPAMSACPATGSVGQCRIFIARVNPTGSRLDFATLFGGSGFDTPTAIAVDPSGNTHVVGRTSSVDWPSFNGIQPTNGYGPVFTSTDGGDTWISSSAGVGGGTGAFIWPRTGPVYVRADQTVFRSDDNGASWTSLHIDGENVAVLAVDPRTPSIVYGLGLPGGRWHKSLDSGHSWTPLSLPRECSGIVVSPAQPSVLYAGDTHICRSDNGGSTWTHVFATTQDFERLSVLAADPQSAAIAYASFQNPGFRGIWKTVDAGRTWSPTGELPRLMPDTPSRFPMAFIIDAENPTMLYAGLAGGVVRSRDGGTTWESISDGLPGSAGGQTAAYNIWQDPARPAFLYAVERNAGLYRSSDRGAHWTRLNMPLPDIFGIAVNDGRMLVGGTTEGDGFLVTLDRDGRLVLSTYVGGAGSDQVTDVVVSDRSSITITGTTTSAYWPAASGGEREYHGGFDAFWMRLAFPLQR